MGPFLRGQNHIHPCWAWILQGLDTTRTGHYKDWILQALDTTRTGYYKDWILQGLDTTRNGYYKDWTLQGLDTTRTGYYKDWILQGLDTTRTGHYKDWTLQGLDTTRTGHYISSFKYTNTELLTSFVLLKNYLNAFILTAIDIPAVSKVKVATGPNKIPTPPPTPPLQGNC